MLDRIWEKVQKRLAVFDGEDNLPCRNTTSLVLFGSCSIVGGLELLPSSYPLPEESQVFNQNNFKKRLTKASYTALIII